MWYDPIDQRWYKMPTQKEPEVIVETKEDDYERANRINRQRDIWDAVVDVSSAQ